MGEASNAMEQMIMCIKVWSRKLEEAAAFWVVLKWIRKEVRKRVDWIHVTQGC